MMSVIPYSNYTGCYEVLERVLRCADFIPRKRNSISFVIRPSGSTYGVKMVIISHSVWINVPVFNMFPDYNTYHVLILSFALFSHIHYHFLQLSIDFCRVSMITFTLFRRQFRSLYQYTYCMVLAFLYITMINWLFTFFVLSYTTEKYLHACNFLQT